MDYIQKKSDFNTPAENKLTLSRFLSFDGYYSSDDEQINEFYKVINKDNAGYDINSMRWKLIPEQLRKEVENLVERNYGGNDEKYFEDNMIYFDTFLISDLLTANIADDEIEAKELRITKLANSTKSLRRQIRNKRNNALWHASALLKLVGKGNSNYCSSTIFNEFKLTKAREQEFIKKSVIVGTDKKVIPLAKATKTAEQNIAEKINLLKTVEKIAEEKGFTWIFVTLTLEGEFHPNPTLGKNTYNGVSPKESAKLLNNKIKNVRALMHKRGIKAGTDYLGCFTAEAHKDGVMHKHGLLYLREEDIEAVRNAFFYTFPNLNEKSFVINNGQAKASSYVFKYVMKSINHFDKDLNILSLKKEDDEALYNAMLNNAFRSYNNIRGFSFFGIDNCLTKFRFAARNYKEMGIPAELEELIKDNDLYEMMKNGFLDMLENIYVKLGENRQFIGCKFNGKKYIKRFFNLVKGALSMKDEEIENSAEVAKMKTEKVMVILNPNYSRETRKAEKPKPKIVKTKNGETKFYFEYNFC